MVKPKTAEEAYQLALDDTLGHEGGWYDGSEKRDPNPTMYGVTQNTYDYWRARWRRSQQSVRLISKDEVRNIYRAYWTDAELDTVGQTHPVSAICLFDMSINAGQTTARIIMQKALGVDADGLIGPNTRRALALAPDLELASRICFERIRHYANLAKSDKMRPNLLSWVIRTIQFRERYLK